MESEADRSPERCSRVNDVGVYQPRQVAGVADVPPHRVLHLRRGRAPAVLYIRTSSAEKRQNNPNRGRMVKAVRITPAWYVHSLVIIRLVTCKTL